MTKSTILDSSVFLLHFPHINKQIVSSSSIKYRFYRFFSITFNDKFYPASVYLLLCDFNLRSFQGNCPIFLVNVFCKLSSYDESLFVLNWFSLLVFIICFKCFSESYSLQMLFSSLFSGKEFYWKYNLTF